MNGLTERLDLKAQLNVFGKGGDPFTMMTARRVDFILTNHMIKLTNNCEAQIIKSILS